MRLSRFEAVELLFVAARRYERSELEGEGYIFTHDEMAQFMKAVYREWLDEMADGIAREIGARKLKAYDELQLQEKKESERG